MNFLYLAHYLHDVNRSYLSTSADRRFCCRNLIAWLATGLTILASGVVLWGK